MKQKRVRKGQDAQPGNRVRAGNPQIQELGKATQFQPGQSGNPNGRPLDLVSQELRRMMRSACPYDADGRTWAQLISLAICRRALKGDVAATREICDRTEGKPMQSLSVSGGLDMNMTIEQIDEQINAFCNKIRARGEAPAWIDTIQGVAQGTEPS